MNEITDKSHEHQFDSNKNWKCLRLHWIQAEARKNEMLKGKNTKDRQKSSKRRTKRCQFGKVKMKIIYSVGVLLRKR